jgi:hypothetical protein
MVPVPILLSLDENEAVRHGAWQVAASRDTE